MLGSLTIDGIRFSFLSTGVKRFGLSYFLSILFSSPFIFLSSAHMHSTTIASTMAAALVLIMDYDSHFLILPNLKVMWSKQHKIRLVWPSFSI